MTIRSHSEVITVKGNNFHPVNGVYQTFSWPYSVEESYVGGDNPSWLKAVKAGTNATNPLNAVKSFVEFQPIDMQATLWYAPDRQIGTYTDGTRGYPQGRHPTLPTASHSPSALAECVARFNQKLQEQMRPLQGLAFVGEIRETIRMIKQAGRRLVTHIGDYVKRARKFLRSDYKSRKALRGLSDLWLEYAFGWTPLYYDIAAAVQSLVVPRSRRILIRAWGEYRSVAAQLSTNPIGIGVMNILVADHYSRNTNVSSAQQVAALDFTLVGQPSDATVSSIQTAADRWGFTAREFVPAVWELIPYSFLIDYYVNVGDIIDAAFADRRAIAWGYQTQRTTAVNEIRWSNCRRKSGSSSYYPIITSNHPGSIKVGTKRFTRTSSLATIPPITIGYPDFGGAKYANQLALILGRLRTR